MRGIVLGACAAAGVFCGAAGAQTPPGAQTATTPTLPGGTPVGKPFVQPVGAKLPSVGTQLPKVGNPPSGYGGTPNAPVPDPRQSIPNFDPKMVVAPYPTPPNNSGNFWDDMNKWWLGMFADKTKPQANAYTPGIARRNRERREREEQWRRD